MTFDSSRAWSRAIEWVRTHIGIVLPLAGVFVLIPSLALFWFTGDLQAALEAKVQSKSPERVIGDVMGLMGQLYGLVLLTSLVQSIGTMAMTVVFADRSRPTVGEAISRALRCLPTVIGVTLIALLVFVGVALVVALVIGLIAGLAGAVAGPGTAALVGTLAAIPLIGVMVWLMIRLSLISPIIVLEGATNPIEAIRRSWRMTEGHVGSLLLFYLLLGVCYVVISVIIESLAGLVTGGGAFASQTQLTEGARIANGLVTSILGAVAAAVFTAVITACYEQLSGSDSQSTGDTFS